MKKSKIINEINSLCEGYLLNEVNCSEPNDEYLFIKKYENDFYIEEEHPIKEFISTIIAMLVFIILSPVGLILLLALIVII